MLDIQNIKSPLKLLKNWKIKKGNSQTINKYCSLVCYTVMPLCDIMHGIHFRHVTHLCLFFFFCILLFVVCVSGVFYSLDHVQWHHLLSQIKGLIIVWHQQWKSISFFFSTEWMKQHRAIKTRLFTFHCLHSNWFQIGKNCQEIEIIIYSWKWIIFQTPNLSRINTKCVFLIFSKLQLI